MMERMLIPSIIMSWLHCNELVPSPVHVVTAVVLLLALPPALEYDLISEYTVKHLKDFVTEVCRKLKHKLEDHHRARQLRRWRSLIFTDTV